MTLRALPSGVGGPVNLTKGVSVVGGAATYAAMGAPLGPIGIAAGAVVGAAAGYLGSKSKSAPNPLPASRFRQIRVALAHAGHWDDADRLFLIYKSLGNASPYQIQHFHPKLGPTLRDGSQNYSAVAVHGHQTMPPMSDADILAGNIPQPVGPVAAPLTAGFDAASIGMLAAGIVAFGVWNLYRASPRRRRRRS